MNLADVKIIPSSRLWPPLGVGHPFGQSLISRLESKQLINPERTPTGRTILSFNECQVVFDYLGQ